MSGLHMFILGSYCGFIIGLTLGYGIVSITYKITGKIIKFWERK